MEKCGRNFSELEKYDIDISSNYIKEDASVSPMVSVGQFSTLLNLARNVIFSDLLKKFQFPTQSNIPCNIFELLNVISSGRKSFKI